MLGSKLVRFSGESTVTDGFQWSSCAIEARARYFPFDIGFFQGPAYYEIPALRVIIHETLHLWQVLGTGFAANVAAEEWLAVLAFERGDDTAAYRGLRERSVRSPAPGELAAMALFEALARYWDIHILGAEKVRSWADSGWDRSARVSTAPVIAPDAQVARPQLRRSMA